MKTIAASIVLLTCLLTLRVQTQNWQFLGPDSAGWRSIIQMDVSFGKGMPPRIGAATSNGIAVHFGTQWRYPLRNFTEFGSPWDPTYYFDLRSIHFSRWDDSVAFVGYDGTTFEPVWGAYRINGLYGDWQVPYYFLIECGGMGRNTQFSFVFPQRDSGGVYAWVCPFMRSTDNGLSWTSSSTWEWTLYPGFFLAINFSRDSVLYLGGHPGYQDTIGVYRTNPQDSGRSRLYTFQTSYTRADFLAQGDTLVLATSKSPATGDSSCGIIRSSDHGKSWVQVLSSVNVAALARDEGEPSVMFAASERGVYRSVDAGATWRMYNNTLPSLHFVGIKKDPYSDTLYVATQDSGIYKVFGLAVNVVKEPQLPKQCVLEQNYPNPFNPSTDIRFEISESRLVTLKVYDLLGRELATLVNQWKPAGRYLVNWDATGLPTGVYFCRMQAGDFVETKKLLLLR